MAEPGVMADRVNAARERGFRAYKIGWVPSAAERRDGRGDPSAPPGRRRADGL